MTTVTITDQVVTATVVDDLVTATIADQVVTATVADSTVSQADVVAKADKVSGATNGNVAGLDVNGNLTDSGHAPLTLAAGDGVSINEASNVATIATSGTATTLFLPDGRPVVVTRGQIQSVGTSLYDAILALNPTAFWWGQETTGTVATDRIDRGNQDGVYSGVQLADMPRSQAGLTAPYYNGSAYTNIYSSTLNTNFSTTAGTFLVVPMIPSASVWTDSERRVIIQIRDTNGDRVQIRKDSASNTIKCLHDAGGTLLDPTVGGLSTLDPFVFAFSWSQLNDRLRLFVDGAQQGSDTNGLGTWAGTARSSTRCNIGVDAQTPTDPFIGWIGYVVYWNSELTPANIATMVNP